MGIYRTLLCRVALFLAWSTVGPAWAGEEGLLSKEPFSVAVASNFAAPLSELVKAFGKGRVDAVTVSSGSTGKLFAQIANGGPFDVFLSADTTSVDRLVKDGLAEKDSKFTYAVGRLALYAPSAAEASEDMLRGASFGRFAIANPKTAPYGAAAMETLRRLGVADALKDRLVYGENIAQTLQFVASGAAEAGLVAYSQVNKRDSKTVWLVPERLHSPIRQDACLLRHGNDNDAARAFLAFLQSDEARRIIEAFGYGIVR